MKDTCPHVGKEHPMYFQCVDCEDTADECNCNYCPMVFCELCQEMINIGCYEVTNAWVENHPDKDLRLEKMKILGVISDYNTSISRVNDDE